MGTRLKRATNVSLNAELIEEARILGISLSRACEAGLVAEIRQAKAARWLAENGKALDASNAWAEAKGLPLAHHRLF
ncbi:type II toxin-antitoxin system CcdA family antitoxin [Sphingomonas sp.]|jgi:antitoxin CcdA|uniref:type II toxin-antitoxin system CcdA family antitoxin n=1 Tax=Sphingomonas sp. TaxID=28214 RepID=UPI002DF0B96A|nr:type II toxin-antitoxin system CcdA family antitoxin [Sphingomonas sp.]